MIYKEGQAFLRFYDSAPRPLPPALFNISRLDRRHEGRPIWTCTRTWNYTKLLLVLLKGVPQYWYLNYYRWAPLNLKTGTVPYLCYNFALKSYFASLSISEKGRIRNGTVPLTSVADPDPPDPRVFGPPALDPDPDTLVTGMDPDPDPALDPDPDPSIIMQK
jgi:hypothetical protein